MLIRTRAPLWGLLMVASCHTLTAGEADLFARSPAQRDAAGDAAFRSYFDPTALQRALNSLDAAAVADQGFSLAAGERVLLRTHSRFPAKVVLNAALRIALESRDQETLLRLRAHAAKASDDELMKRIVAGQRLASTSRAATEPLDTRSVGPESYTLFRQFLHQIRRAKALHDREQLERIRRQLFAIDRFPESLLQRLQNELEDAAKAQDAEPPRGYDALRQLAGASRASVPCTKCSTLGYYVTMEEKGKRPLTVKVPVRKRCDRCGGSGYISTKPLEDKLSEEQKQRERRAKLIAQSISWELGVVHIDDSGRVWLNGRRTAFTARSKNVSGRVVRYYNRMLHFPNGIDRVFQWYRFENEGVTKKRPLS